jgi:hypothetical protein
MLILILVVIAYLALGLLSTAAMVCMDALPTLYANDGDSQLGAILLILFWPAVLPIVLLIKSGRWSILAINYLAQKCRQAKDKYL